MPVLARRWIDRDVAELAGSQHGVVTAAQLVDLGLGERAVRARSEAGKLHRVRRGVYAVGHPLLTPKSRMMSAVLACGAGAFISHRSAGALWGIGPAGHTAIDVSSPRRSGRGHDGIAVHRASEDDAGDLVEVDGIPCASVARTLLGLASVVGRPAFERAVGRAETLGLLDRREVEAVVAGSGGRPGVRLIRSLLSELRPEPAFTRSELERRFLALCRRRRLPRPAANLWVALADGGMEVDFLWAAPRLVAELDGHRAHGTRRAFERDRRRDQLLAAAGYRVVRFTWRQVVERPHEVTETLRSLLDPGDHPAASPAVEEGDRPCGPCSALGLSHGV